MSIQRTTITVTGAAGGAGVATATATSAHIINGRISRIHIAYLDSPPATTDVTIVEATNSPAGEILTVTDAAADGWFYPQGQAQTPAGADITGQGAPIEVADYVTVTIAQANNGDGVEVTIVWNDTP